MSLVVSAFPANFHTLSSCGPLECCVFATTRPSSRFKQQDAVASKPRWARCHGGLRRERVRRALRRQQLHVADAGRGRGSLPLVPTSLLCLPSNQPSCLSNSSSSLPRPWLPFHSLSLPFSPRRPTRVHTGAGGGTCFHSCRALLHPSAPALWMLPVQGLAGFRPRLQVVLLLPAQGLAGYRPLWLPSLVPGASNVWTSALAAVTLLLPLRRAAFVWPVGGLFLAEDGRLTDLGVCPGWAPFLPASALHLLRSAVGALAMSALPPGHFGLAAAVRRGLVPRPAALLRPREPD